MVKHFSPGSGLPRAIAGAMVGLWSVSATALEVEPLRPLGSASHVVIPQARGFGLRAGEPAIEIESVHAHVTIRNQMARTTLDIHLQNPGQRLDEAVLLLPVPDGAVVSGFAFEGQQTEPTALVMPRDEARTLYDAIVDRVRDPALLEFAGCNLIRSSVFPVPAGGGQRVRITYEQVLGGDGDRVDYVLPRSESLERQRPWSITVDLRSDQPISTVYSPSHEIVTERRAPGRVSVRMPRSAELEPGPFRLAHLLQRDGVAASLFAYPDPSVGDRSIRLRVDEGAGRLRIAVQDQGRGVSAAEASAIFAPFERCTNGGTDKPGIGLGLALARGLARDLGGDLALETGTGTGASFALTLPVDRDHR